MSINLKKLPLPLIEAVETGNLVPFIGAGISRHAKTKDPKGFPTWTQFLEGLIETGLDSEFVNEEEAMQINKLKERGKYLMAAEALKRLIPKDHLEYYIKKRFDATYADIGAIHRALLQLGAPLIMTTNYDTLLEKAYAQEFGDIPTCWTHKHAPQVQQFLKTRHHGFNRPAIFKIHGTVERPSDIVFAEMDYRKLIYGLPGYRAVLSALFVTRVVLMLGFSYTDPELTVITESLREYFDERSSPDYILLPSGDRERVERARLRHDFGLQVIEYDPSEDPHGHDLLQFVEELARYAPARV